MEAQLRELGVKELKRRAKELGCDEEKIEVSAVAGCLTLSCVV